MPDYSFKSTFRKTYLFRKRVTCETQQFSLVISFDLFFSSVQMPEERNYHIFYRLLAGLTDKDKSSLHLTEAKDYHYLSQGNCYVCEGMDDKEAFTNIRRAMKVK